MTTSASGTSFAAPYVAANLATAGPIAGLTEAVTDDDGASAGGGDAV